MAITYPANCNTASERSEYLYRAQELLRLIHNIFGKWFREGLTQTEYDQFPQKIKNVYPYRAQITKQEFEDFLRLQFDPRHELVIRQILLYRDQLQNSGKWTIDVMGI